MQKATPAKLQAQDLIDDTDPQIEDYSESEEDWRTCQDKDEAPDGGP